LSDLLSAYVRLRVPSVEQVEARSIPETFGRLVGQDETVHMVRQAFRPHFRGESLLILHAEAATELSQLLGITGGARGGREADLEQKAMILEVANILTGACVGKLSELLQTATTFSPPALVMYAAPVETVADFVGDDVTEGLMIRTGFAIEARRPIFGHLIILVPPTAIGWLSDALDRFLGEL